MSGQKLLMHSVRNQLQSTNVNRPPTKLVALTSKPIALTFAIDKTISGISRGSNSPLQHQWYRVYENVIICKIYGNTSCTLRREAFRGAMVLFDEGAISKPGFNGPYTDSSRQKGFVSFGVSHVMKILGSAEVAQRSSWYQKWNVHLLARPEVRFHHLTNTWY